MAQLRLQPPEPFNFWNPDDWLRWKQRFERFRVASGLASSDAVQQISTLLYCIGEEAEAVLTSTNIIAEGREQYDTVVTKFEFFRSTTKYHLWTGTINRRHQQEGETAEQYIMELYRLAENCDYGPLKDEMIRDATLSQQLQLDAELTLDKAKTKVHQREAVGEQQKELKGKYPMGLPIWKQFVPVNIPKPQGRTHIKIVKWKLHRLPAIALDVGRNRIPVTNAPQKMRSVTAAIKKGTRVQNVAVSSSPKLPVTL